MRRTEETRFAYRAHAVGIAARFSRPRSEFLEAQAVSALPSSGGVASARSENVRFRDIISFESAQTHTIGIASPETGGFSTLVTASVKGLNVMNVVTADWCCARLASHHFIDDREPSIVTLGSYFQNLRVGGKLIDFDPDHQLMCDWDTWSKADGGCQGRLAGTAKAPGLIATSILTNIRAGDFEVEGHAIHFPEFGTIYLGEIHISEGERRLTMLRISFGCSFEGDMSCSEVAGNGRPVPPF
jgi:hypothetical protein